MSFVAAEFGTILPNEEGTMGGTSNYRPLAANPIVTVSQWPPHSEERVVARLPTQVNDRTPLMHRSSASYTESSATTDKRGRSTFGQTLVKLFNCVAMLAGSGLLAAPLAFAYTGWLTGAFLVISYGWISSYTAKVLGRMILSDPKLRCYTDISKKAFGPWFTSLVSFVLCLELFPVSVLLVTLYADSLHCLLPHFSTNAYKLCSLVLILPTVFLPLSLLAYSSILGIISTILVIIVILIDGLTKQTSPGSLWSPAVTSLQVSNWTNLGIAFGLFMAGFGCHPVVISLARDMAQPEKFEHMINWAFGISAVTYALVGCVGYIMFGNLVSGEINIDLLKIDDYNKLLNRLVLWMLVLSPLTKFALVTQPLTSTLEFMMHIAEPRIGHEQSEQIEDKKTAFRKQVKQMLRVIVRIGAVLLSVATSIMVPAFSDVLAFLGCSSAFLLCIIGPLAANAAISRRCARTDWLIMVVALFMACWGTTAVFIQ